MRLRYDAASDSLYIGLNDGPGVDSHEIGDGLIVDLDARGNPVGIDIQRASRRLDLTTLETVALPTVTMKMTA
jgi:uncharacterized protein YuzE